MSRKKLEVLLFLRIHMQYSSRTLFFFFGRRTFRICLFLISLFIFGVLGLHCYPWAFSSWGERGLLFIVVPGLLIAVASLVAEHRL